MPDTLAEDGEDKYRPYRDAIRRRVCAICLDGKDDGCCGLAGPPACAIDEHLPRLVDAILDVRDRRDDAYAAAVEARVCGHCCAPRRPGPLRLRRDGRCTVSVYLPLIVEAVEEVEAAPRDRVGVVPALPPAAFVDAKTHKSLFSLASDPAPH